MGYTFDVSIKTLSMDIPYFIQHPPTETELETARLMLQGMTIKEVGDKRCLGEETIKAHTRSLRFKFHANNMIKTLGRMVKLKFLPDNNFGGELPPDWEKYIKE
jgi:DNA-binding NarL/FixJ family response regulator